MQFPCVGIFLQIPALMYTASLVAVYVHFPKKMPYRASGLWLVHFLDKTTATGRESERRVLPNVLLGKWLHYNLKYVLSPGLAWVCVLCAWSVSHD